MGRSPCCEKVGLKKGPWTPEEDQKLLDYIEQHGHGSWRALPAKAGLQRCGKSCRLRWTNYLRPDIKRGKFSLQEEQTIIQLHALLGNRWSAIAAHLAKRTDNEIKNYWNTHLKKRLTKMGIDPVTHKLKSDALSSGSGHSKDAANLSHMAQWESARLEAEARLVRESKLVSNPSPAQLISKTPAQPALPPCLDVLKAWQLGAWSKSTTSSMFPIPGDDLESPTSTLNFSANTLPVQTVAFNESTNTAERILDDAMALQDMTCTMESVWLADSFRDGNENMPLSYFMEGFANILAYNNCDGQNSSIAGESLDNEETNNNYWNSILNLVNASSSGSSPVF